ncbi:RNA polymerase sigma-70 factor [Rapidithrix thailandica]|uniref:RNA polymerase sigma-70 factor n=1 Tax=Rapidithrix thailandica TaxID=413964 RepID=A0AAW9SC32_9BACT
MEALILQEQQQTENYLSETSPGREGTALVPHLQKGEDWAFEYLYKNYYVRLCLYAESFVRERHTAEEVVSEVFLKLWNKRQELQINTSIKSYLYKAIHNLCLNHINARKVRDTHYQHLKVLKNQQQEELVTLPKEAFKSEQEELEEKVRQALEALPERCREVLVLSKFHKMKYREIAEHLGISVKTVETQISRGLLKLRELLK